MYPQGKAQQLKCWDDKTASGPEKVNQVSLKHKNDTRVCIGVSLSMTSKATQSEFQLIRVTKFYFFLL